MPKTYLPKAEPSTRQRRGHLGQRALLGGLLVLLVLTCAIPGQAHNLGESYLYLQIYEETVTGRFEISLSDYNASRGFVGTAQEITPENFATTAADLERYYLDHVRVADDSGPLTIEFTKRELLGEKGTFAQLSFDFGGLEGVPETMTFDYSVLFDEEPGHRGFLLVEHNWATGTFANENQISLVFAPDSQRQDFDLTSSGAMRGFLAVVGLGIDHIWEGIDHILFLLALLLPAVLRREDGRWEPVEKLGPALLHIVKIVTAFTIAHSITLTLASLGIVSLPGKLVEVIIAGSIAVAALDLLIPVFRGRIWLVVIGFGLFHGFGFAGALSDMGILREKIGLTLFGFNLGVEIGQIVIVAALTPLLFLIRRWPVYRKVVVPALAVGMILLSCAWVVERGFEVDIPIRESLPPALEKLIP